VHVDTVLLKVASRCNLDCDYCYVYHMGDDSWRALPKRFSEETERAVAAELSELMRSQGRPFSIVLHGGEPLLLGANRLDRLLAELRGQLGASCSISIQTNGVLIDESILDICAARDVTISVSLDGPADVHDRNRKDIRRQPTHARVIAGVAALKAHPQGSRLFSGVLAVVDPVSDPGEVYDYFKALGVPSVDFLYRDGNHSALPPGKAAADSVVFGQWMTVILDRYVSDPSPFRIRMLDDMMKLLLGGRGVKEGVGLTDYGILVIDTDGAIKKNDTLKSSPLGDQFGQSWMIGSTPLAEIAASAEFEAYHVAQRPSARECLTCDLLQVCGGGMVTHRFKEGVGYDNPTIFCADQKLLIDHMRRILAASLSMNRAA
jgi:uncharacterized protein